MIDLILLNLVIGLGVYTILDFLYYLLLSSILLNNYKVIYLVNNRELLELSSFIKVGIDKIVKVRSLSLLIVRKGRRVIRNYLNRVNRPGIEDLVLINIVVVDRFYINIVLEARLY